MSYDGIRFNAERDVRKGVSPQAGARSMDPETRMMYLEARTIFQNSSANLPAGRRQTTDEFVWSELTKNLPKLPTFPSTGISGPRKDFGSCL